MAMNEHERKKDPLVEAVVGVAYEIGNVLRAGFAAGSEWRSEDQFQRQLT
jgi:hypothetical protein